MTRKTLLDNALLGLGTTLALVLPAVTIFVNNYRFFTFGPSHLAMLLLTAGMVVALALFGVLSLTCRWRIHPAVQLFFVGFIVLCWIQSNFFATSMPSLPDEPIEMSKLTRWFCWLELTVFTIVICVVVFFRRVLLRNITRVFAAIIIYYCIAIVVESIKYQPPEIDSILFTFEEKHKFTFAAQENVILIVVDCMGRKLFHDTVTKYPELNHSLKDFIRLDNMQSPLPRTMGAVPAMITGVEFEYGEEEFGSKKHEAYLLDAYKSPKSIINRLKSKQFRCEAYPYMPYLVPCADKYFDNVIRRVRNDKAEKILRDAWCIRMTPFFFQMLLDITPKMRKLFVSEFDTGAFLNKDLTFDQAISLRLNHEFAVGAYPRMFKYLHLQGAHDDIMTDEQLELTGDADIYRQLRGSLTIVEDLLRLLREHGLYDAATIVVTGDHSEAYEPEIMTLVKRPKQSFDSMQSDLTPHVVSELPEIMLK